MALLLLALLALLALWGLLCARAGTPGPAPRWPPGPRPLPLVGNLHLLRGAQQDEALMQLGKQYGPVFTVHLGHQKTVVLTGYEAVKEALVGTGQELAGRPPIAIFQLINGGGGVFFSSGPRWRAARQLTVRALHGLGVGRAPVANKVLQELRCLTAQLDSYEGRPFPLALLRWAPSNITFTLLFGQRFDYRDPVFLSLLGLVDEVMVLLGKPSVQLFNLYPRLGALLQLHRPVLRKIEEVRAILRALLEARRHRTPPRGPQQSYLDALIQQGQGTPVLALLNSVLLDETQWKTPRQFNPGHFLDANGRFVKRPAFLPFSAGRRVCVGESLARSELFLLFAGLLQRYRLLPPPGLSVAALDTTPAPAFTARPSAQVLCAMPRLQGC